MISGLDLPGVHKVASDLSDTFQFKYLWLVRFEYLTLFIASIFTLDLTNGTVYYIAYALIFLVGLIILLVRSFMRPEQSWYRARAVAESVKTSAWRFAMVAHPYNEAEPNKRFLNLIREVLQANKVLSEGGSSPNIRAIQVTSSMEDARTLTLSRRVRFYLEYRVRDQQTWYIKKARSNQRAFTLWIWASCIAYAIAIILALSHIGYPTWKSVPIEPLIVIATSSIGWVQIKKHSELATSYTLTATEIGIAAEDAMKLDKEELFSDFVNDMELAFSREHTQWIARQKTAG